MTVILRRPDGTARALSLTAWSAPATPGERHLLRSLTGPVLDIGCGPGRLVLALAEQGVPALGVDASRHAAQLSEGRGAAVLRRSVFERLPGEGRWSSLLLFDGNIGIGGSPVTLLRRAADLLAPDGHTIIETEPPGMTTEIGWARLENNADITEWFPWAWVGAHDIDDLAAAAGLRRVGIHVVDGRWFTILSRRGGTT